MSFKFMAAVTTCSDFGAPKLLNFVPHYMFNKAFVTSQPRSRLFFFSSDYLASELLLCNTSFVCIQKINVHSHGP